MLADYLSVVLVENTNNIFFKVLQMLQQIWVLLNVKNSWMKLVCLLDSMEYNIIIMIFTDEQMGIIHKQNLSYRKRYRRQD